MERSDWSKYVHHFRIGNYNSLYTIYSAFPFALWTSFGSTFIVVNVDLYVQLDLYVKSIPNFVGKHNF